MSKTNNKALLAITLSNRVLAKDFRYFRKYYFSHYNKLPDASMHREISEQLIKMTTSRGTRLALAAPRESGKSTLVNLQYVLYTICNKTEHCIVIIAHTAEQATKALNNIKNELETNPLLIRDFPQVCEVGQKPSPKRWKNNEIITRNDIRITAVSTAQEIRGIRHNQYRPTLIILDDAEANNDAKTQDSFGDAFDWFTKVILNLGTSQTNIIFMGTIHHYNSLLAHFIDPKQHPDWIKLLYRSIISYSLHPELWGRWSRVYNRQESFKDKDGPDAAREFFLENKELMLEGTEALWPERYDYYALMKKREDEGAVSFDSEQQNEPINPRDCTFSPGERHEWTDRFASEEELLNTLEGKLLIVGACDPSLGRDNRKGDYSAIITIAIATDTGTMYVLDADIERRSPDKTIEDIIAHHTRRNYHYLGFESNQFQEFMATELQKRARASGHPLSVEEVKHTTDKIARIQTLQPMVKNGTIQFSKKHQALLDQMKYFPKGSHDDGLDALQMAVELAHNATDRVGITFFEYDPDTGESKMISI